MNASQRARIAVTCDVRTVSGGASMAIAGYESSRDQFKPAEEVRPQKRDNFEFIPWGEDNDFPLRLLERIRDCEVMSQNMLFNITTGYAGSVRVRTPDGKKLERSHDAYRFFSRSRLSAYWLNQVTDMKHFYFTVTLFILSTDRSKIVRIVHKDAVCCRFSPARDGRIEYVYFGDWSAKEGKFEKIPVLDELDPLTDLMERTGREIGSDGQKTDRGELMFAAINRFPGADCTYYPMPYYTAVFNSGWYDMKQTIAVGKRAKISNHAPVKYLVTIEQWYWERLFQYHGCTGNVEKQEEIKDAELKRIETFVTGIENSGKMFTTSSYTDVHGNSTPAVKITLLDTGKEGGDWIEDTEEASNMICYAMNIHPSLIGATPGKTKGNFSGSDKRELYTMKQSQEKPFQDILLEPLEILCEFNGWDLDISVPMVTLTTLDKGKDAETNRLK